MMNLRLKSPEDEYIVGDSNLAHEYIKKEGNRSIEIRHHLKK